MGCRSSFRRPDNGRCCRSWRTQRTRGGRWTRQRGDACTGPDVGRQPAGGTRHSFRPERLLPPVVPSDSGFVAEMASRSVASGREQVPRSAARSAAVARWFTVTRRRVTPSAIDSSTHPGGWLPFCLALQGDRVIESHGLLTFARPRRAAGIGYTLTPRPSLRHFSSWPETMSASTDETRFDCLAMAAVRRSEDGSVTTRPADSVTGCPPSRHRRSAPYQSPWPVD
jgi:hypothetical protein